MDPQLVTITDLVQWDELRTQELFWDAAVDMYWERIVKGKLVSKQVLELSAGISLRTDLSIKLCVFKVKP